jgi:acyl carrier protein
MSTLNRVIQVTAEYLALDPATITAESDFATDLGADSLVTIELAMKFEEAFGIEIDDDTAKKLIKVKDVVAFVDKQRSGAL